MRVRSLLVALWVVALGPGTSALAPPAALAGEASSYLRGDANTSGSVDLSDAIYLLSYLFLGGPRPLCEGVSDANRRNGTDIADAVYLLTVLFAGGETLTPLSAEEIADCDEARILRRGRAVFESADPLGANAYSCASCHAATSPESGSPARVLAAHGLGDVLRRPSYFAGAITELLDAVNRCRDDWLDAPAFAPDDERFELLTRYLESIDDGSGSGAERLVEIVAPTRTGPSEGDPVAGCAVFQRACASCHGALGAGRPRLGPDLWTRVRTPDELRALVRLSGPTPAMVPDTLWRGLRGGRMPFFTPGRLSDTELEDLVAYFAIALDPGRRDCDDVADPEPTLLRTGTFITILHGVRGRAEEWSDRRIRLRGFTYDGQGPPEVLVWLYDRRAGDPHAILRGWPISAHLARDVPYVSENLEYEVPEDLVGRYNTVAIWCTEFQTTYGEARLSSQ